MRLQWRAIWFMDKGGLFSDFMTNLRRLKVWSLLQVLHLHLAAIYGNLKRGSPNRCWPKGRRTSLSFEKRKTSYCGRSTVWCNMHWWAQQQQKAWDHWGITDDRTSPPSQERVEKNSIGPCPRVPNPTGLWVVIRRVTKVTFLQVNDVLHLFLSLSMTVSLIQTQSTSIKKVLYNQLAVRLPQQTSVIISG